MDTKQISISINNKKSLTDVEKRFALRITEKMTKYPISFCFLKPVDPARDGAPDYLSVIKYPMDLSTVRQRLETSFYSNVEEWRKDVNQIWTNALTYNRNADSPFHTIALEMKEIFRRKTEFIPHTETDEWFYKARKVNKKIRKVSENRLLVNYAPPVKSIPGKKNKHKENIFD